MPLDFSSILSKQSEVNESLTQFIQGKYLESATYITSSFSDIGQLVIGDNFFILSPLSDDLYDPQFFITLKDIGAFFLIDYLYHCNASFVSIIFTQTPLALKDMLDTYVNNKNKQSSISRERGWLNIEGVKAISIESRRATVRFEEVIPSQNNSSFITNELDFSVFLNKLSKVQRAWALKNLNSIV